MKDQRKYDREFKWNTVKLYHESGKSLSKLALDLGIPKATLASWIKHFREQREDSFPGKGYLTPDKEELYQLRKELADVRQERDILKKAIAIFSKAKS